MKKRMTEKDYITLKLLVKGGATLEQLKEIHPVSSETLRRIKRTESYDEYRALQLEYTNRSIENRKAAQEAEKPVGVADTAQNVTGEDKHTEILTDTKIDKAIELLTEISANLARVVDDLYGIKPGVADGANAK